MKGIFLLLFFFAAFSLSSQELTTPILDGKKVEIKKVLKKYTKDQKLHSVEFKYLKDYLVVSQFDSTKIIELLGMPAKTENVSGQKVLVYNCYVNYNVSGYRNWQEQMKLYLGDDNRISELKSAD